MYLKINCPFLIIIYHWLNASLMISATSRDQPRLQLWWWTCGVLQQLQLQLCSRWCLLRVWSWPGVLEPHLSWWWVLGDTSLAPVSGISQLHWTSWETWHWHLGVEWGLWVPHSDTLHMWSIWSVHQCPGISLLSGHSWVPVEQDLVTRGARPVPR